MNSAISAINKTWNAHSPQILAGIGSTCFIGSVIFAVKSTPKAITLVDSAAYKKWLETDDSDYTTYDEWLCCEEDSDQKVSCCLNKLTIREAVIATWRCYVPTAALAALGITCFVASSKISSSRNVALVSAASMAEKALVRYQEKVVDILGEDKANEIRDEVAKSELEDNSIIETNIVWTGHGEDLFFDPLIGRAFYSDVESVRSAINDFNKDLIGGVYGDLNDWYYHLGLPGVEIGEDLGWSSNKLLDIRFTGTVTDKNKPAVVLDYVVRPSTSYRYGM